MVHTSFVRWWRSLAGGTRRARQGLILVSALLAGWALPGRAEELPPLRDRVAFGAYTKGLPYFPERLRRIESPSQLGTRLDIVSGFVDWEYVLGEPRDLHLAAGGKRKLLYSWEPHCEGPGGCIAYRDIVQGKLDALPETFRSVTHYFLLSGVLHLQSPRSFQHFLLT